MCSSLQRPLRHVLHILVQLDAMTSRRACHLLTPAFMTHSLTCANAYQTVGRTCDARHLHVVVGVHELIQQALRQVGVLEAKVWVMGVVWVEEMRDAGPCPAGAGGR